MLILHFPYSEKYPASGDNALTDGIRGSDSFRGGDKSWQGFQGTDFEAVIDLEEITDINKIAIGFFQASSSLVFFPSYIEYFTSNDGKNYIMQKKIINKSTLKNPDWTQQDFSINLERTKSRYIKILC